MIMPLAWSKLTEIRDYIPVADLGVCLDLPVNALPLIGESPGSMARFGLKNWFKIGPQQYVHVTGDQFRRFAWAASDGTFTYAQTDDVFFDDGVTCVPPLEVLPDGKSFDWCSVVQAGQNSGDFVSDLDFYSQRRVSFGRHSFHYRHTTPVRGEPPICIIIIPNIWPPIEGQPRHAADASQPFRSVTVPVPSAAARTADGDRSA